MIVAYTAIGGFRGSVYADSFQAVLRVIATAVALAAISWVALNTSDFADNWASAGAGFTDPFPQATLWGAGAFVLGFAAASFGFGLGQPQIFTSISGWRLTQRKPGPLGGYISPSSNSLGWR
ncbi:MAG: hypothetical protein KL785_06055 [Brevundimonas sp.]|nr:hypothetical protein [Brevundimonas sp.]